jgi:hypothetical protein
VGKRTDGGPAFPVAQVIGNNGLERQADDGMSLRDFFAAHAFDGAVRMCMHPDAVTNDGGPLGPRHMAQMAYEFADAMLTERARSNQGDSNG